LCTIRHDVKEVCLEFGYPDPDVNAIVLAIDEACANVIRYGYKYCNNGFVNLKIYQAENEAVFHIIDQCPEICEADITAKPRDDSKPGGLGLHIIHQVMDGVHLIKESSKGNTLELRKQLPAKEA
jgi:anti-sigma regulatory factor (Ser/Thr protein kinase)